MKALVLGGSGHVGSAVSRALTAGGATVAFTYLRSAEKAAALAKELSGTALQADLSTFDGAAKAVDAAVGALGGLDILVYCAGTAGDPAVVRAKRGERLPLIDEAAWDSMLDLTVKGAFAAARAAAPRMKAGGHILFVGSMEGVKPIPAPPHYAAGKGALRALASALAQELGPRGIIVNMVAPGILDGGQAQALSKDDLDDFKKHTAIRRIGTAAEVGKAVAWLALNNTYVTGQTLLFDGGL